MTALDPTSVDTFRGAFAKGLTEAMRSGGISQAALANRLGVSQATVSRWLSGKMVPKDDMLGRIGACLSPEFAWVAEDFRRRPRKPRLRPASVMADELYEYMIAEMTLPQLQNFARNVLKGAKAGAAGGTLGQILAVAARGSGAA